jgi:cytoskeletal protein CcmA (bactofilin family)
MSGTVIGPATRISGALFASEDVIIEGTVEGPVTGEGCVTIAAGSTVGGEVRGQKVILAGTLHHPVLATHSVRLTSTADLHGDIQAPRVAIDEGALFEGQVRMRAPTEEPRVHEERRAPDSPMRGAPSRPSVATPSLPAPPPAPDVEARVIPTLPVLGKRKLVRRTR